MIESSERKLPINARPRVRPKQLPKILVIDIETAPIQALVWKIWEENVGIDQIQQDSSIISFGAKWLGDPKLIYLDTGGRGVDKVRDDLMLMQPLWDLLNEADILVAQNGQAFDTKRINARLIKHGFGPYSPVRQVDTLLTSKRLFKFTSNKLEWLAQQLTDVKKSKHHKFPGIELWLECLKDNADAWKEMKKYNLLDVIACEKVYLKQLAWNDRHPNVGTYDWSLLTTCPRCGGHTLEADGYSTLQAGVYVRYRCITCGAWARGKKMMVNKEARAVKLAS
ncbi:MAG: ribonuclease H-like domain-containing protein [Gammaproteobacteria bacterium]